MDMSDATRLEPTTPRGVVRHHEPMAKHVSWRAGGKARVFFRPADLGDLQAFLASQPAGEPVLFVGSAATCWFATAASTAPSSSRTTRLPASRPPRPSARS